ncbi:MAG: hypothetical protein QW734_05375 [Candidatus Bathyarchaeia archaeon]
MKKYLIILTIVIYLSVVYSQLECMFNYYVVLPLDYLDEIRNPRITYLPGEILYETQEPIHTATPTTVNLIEIGGVKYLVYNFDYKYTAKRCGIVYVGTEVDIADKSCTLGGRPIPSYFGNAKNIINATYGTVVFKGGRVSIGDCYLPEGFFHVFGVKELRYGDEYQINEITLEKGRSYLIDTIYGSVASIRLYAKEYNMICTLSSRYIYYYSKFNEDPNTIGATENSRRYVELFSLRNDIMYSDEYELMKKGYMSCKILEEKDVRLQLYSSTCYENICTSKFLYTPSTTSNSTFVLFWAEITYDYAFLKRVTTIVNFGGYSLLSASNDMYVAYQTESPGKPSYQVFLGKETISDEFFYHRITPIFLSPLSFPSYTIDSTVEFRNLTTSITIPTTFVLTKVKSDEKTFFEYIPTNINRLKSLIVDNEPFELIYRGITYDAGYGTSFAQTRITKSNNFVYRDIYMMKYINLFFSDKTSKSKFIDDNLEIEISFKLYRNDTYEDYRNARCYVEYVYAGATSDTARKIGPLSENEILIPYVTTEGKYYVKTTKKMSYLGITDKDRYIRYDVFCYMPFGYELLYLSGRDSFETYATRAITIFGYDIASVEGLRMFFSIFVIFLIPTIVGYLVKNIYFSSIALILTSAFFYYAGYINLQMTAMIVIISVILVMVVRYIQRVE